MVSKAEFKRALVAAGGARVAAFERPTDDGWLAGKSRLAGWRDVTYVGSKHVVMGDSRLDIDSAVTVEGGGDTFTVTWHSREGFAYGRITYVLTR
jgi:hypothetical protein